MEIRTPPDWKGRNVDTIGVLLHIKRQMDEGRPLWMFTGSSTLQSLVAFYMGHASALRHNNLPNRMEGFLDWLRDVKREMPGNWVEHWLRAYVDDHHQAVTMFLRYVDEFAADNPSVSARERRSRAREAKKSSRR